MDKFTLKTRNKRKTQIVQNLKSSLSQLEFGSACITNTATILNQFKAEKYIIGQGDFGVVYKVDLKLNDNDISPLVIKEGKLTEEEYKLAKNKVYPKEYLINKVANNILKLNLSPNFLLTYAILFCENCSLRNTSFKCSETFMEQMDNDLLSVTDYFFSNNTINTKKSDLMMLSACFQILSAIDILHRTYGILHNDIKADNILVKIIPSTDEQHYSKYLIEGGLFVSDHSYYVPIIEFIPVLSDFGISKILKPSKTFETLIKPTSKNIYGTRVKVVSKNKIQKINNATLTREELKDVNMYPPLEFMEDIQNIIQTFTGGNGFKKGMSHPFLGNDNIKNVLQPFINNDKNKSKPNQLLSYLLIYDVFYTLFQKNPSKSSVISSFSPYEDEEILSDLNNLKI